MDDKDPFEPPGFDGLDNATGDTDETESWDRTDVC